MSAVATPSQLPAPVLRFCRANHLLPHLEIALRIARDTFAPIERTQVSLQEDPDTGEEAVLIDVILRDRTQEILAQKSRYTHRWAESVPPEVYGKIRLLFDLI